MKTIDQFRKTNSFCVASDRVKDMSTIERHYGLRLSWISYDDTGPDNIYTVRLTGHRYCQDVLCDERVKILDRHVHVLEREIIVPWKKG